MKLTDEQMAEVMAEKRLRLSDDEVRVAWAEGRYQAILDDQLQAREDRRLLAKALDDVLELAEKWAAGVGDSHPDHERCRDARDLLAEVEP